jgi:hypothetical protein
MGQARGVGIRWLVLGLALATSAQAEEPAPPQRPPAIWYRASQQCPSDAEFLAKLAGNAAPPRLAEAGDHIDFLVTLVDSGTETVGRLERQTRAGTVAIRELRDPSCARVAEGLALSLGLALEPGQAAPEPASGAAAAPLGDAVAPKLAPSAAPAAQDAVARAPLVKEGARALKTKRRIAIGAAGGALYGLSPRPMARARVFVDLDPVSPPLSPNVSARLGVTGALGSAQTRIGAVRSFVLGGYIEGCPWRVGNARFSLRPCLDFELGASGATYDGSTGLSDSTLWATPGAALCASAALPYRLELEASAGIQVPSTRGEVFAGPSSLYRSEIVLFQATFGLSIGLP